MQTTIAKAGGSFTVSGYSDASTGLMGLMAMTVRGDGIASMQIHVDGALVAQRHIDLTSNNQLIGGIVGALATAGSGKTEYNSGDNQLMRYIGSLDTQTKVTRFTLKVSGLIDYASVNTTSDLNAVLDALNAAGAFGAGWGAGLQSGGLQSYLDAKENIYDNPCPFIKVTSPGRGSVIVSQSDN